MDLDLSAEANEIVESEIGVDAILETATPDESKSIRVVFHKEYSTEENIDYQEEAYQYWVECKAVDVTNAVQNDTIIISNVEYNIESIELAQAGWTVLRLTA